MKQLAYKFKNTGISQKRAAAANILCNKILLNLQKLTKLIQCARKDTSRLLLMTVL